ncbi:hypothetical protein ACLOJK_039591 [Asimina triloba]
MPSRRGQGDRRQGRSSRELEASKARERSAPAEGYGQRRCQWEELSREIERGDKQGDREIEALKAQKRRAPTRRDAHRRYWRKETSNVGGDEQRRW